MTEGAKTFHPNDEGGGEISQPLYCEVVDWGQLRQVARPAVAPSSQEKSDEERELQGNGKSIDQPADYFMNFSFPAPVDQGNHQIFEGGVAEEEARECDEGVAHPLHLLVVEHATGRGDPAEVKVLDAALRYVYSTGFRNTPGKVEVSGGVDEGGAEAEDEDKEEPAHLDQDEDVDESEEEDAHLPMFPPIFYLLPQLSSMNPLTV